MERYDLGAAWKKDRIVDGWDCGMQDSGRDAYLLRTGVHTVRAMIEIRGVVADPFGRDGCLECLACERGFPCTGGTCPGIVLHGIDGPYDPTFDEAIDE